MEKKNIIKKFKAFESASLDSLGQVVASYKSTLETLESEITSGKVEFSNKMEENTSFHNYGMYASNFLDIINNVLERIEAAKKSIDDKSHEYDVDDDTSELNDIYDEFTAFGDKVETLKEEVEEAKTKLYDLHDLIRSICR